MYYTKGMVGNIRRTILISIGVLIAVLLGAWWISGFSLDFMKFFAATPEVTAPTQQQVNTPSVNVVSGGQVRCSPETQSTAAGQAVTLTASGGDGTYTWFAPRATDAAGKDINGVTGASITFSYPGGGTKKVTLQSLRGDGSGSVDTTVCTVEVK